MIPDKQAPDGPLCLISPAGCPSPRERELLRHATAMDAALRTVRLYAEAAENGGGLVASDMILRALDEPYRFPLPGEAEELAAYNSVMPLLTTDEMTTAEALRRRILAA